MRLKTLRTRFKLVVQGVDRMKTIRQLSSELKISKEAVYKKLKHQLKDELAGHSHKIDGVTHIDEEGERLIIQSLCTERQDALEALFEDGQYIYTPEAIEPTRELINALREQIKTKDAQIENQSEHIGLLIRQLGNNQLITQTERLNALPPPVNGQRTKKSIWLKIFRKQPL